VSLLSEFMALINRFVVNYGLGMGGLVTFIPGKRKPVLMLLSWKGSASRRAN